MDNNTIMYRCGICGKQYNTIKERMLCETKCIKEKEAREEAERKAAAKKEAEEKRHALIKEKEARTKEVDDAYNNYLKLRSKYISDYGAYKHTITLDEDDFEKMFNKFDGLGSIFHNW